MSRYIPAPGASFPLQWGRAPRGAEIGELLGRGGSWLGASMGPRPEGRGNMDLVRKITLQLDGLQWGRAPRGAEMMCQSMSVGQEELLQWGRAPRGAEIPSQTNTAWPCDWLQWGRAPRGAEILTAGT